MTNKVICLFVHYFDKNSIFEGKSKNQSEEVRREIVARALGTLRSIKGVDVKVCGYKDHNLVPIDIDLSVRTDDPQLMMYEALGNLSKYRDEYDYFMVVEDDILVGPDVFNNIYEFDHQFGVDQIMLPNRIEIVGRKIYCLDTYLIPGMKNNEIEFKHRLLAVFKNPHSGLLIVSREKLDYLTERVDANFRGKILGGYMASAFAHYHQPFKLYRVADGNDFHTVMHLDRYVEPKQALLHRVKSYVARLILRLI